MSFHGIYAGIPPESGNHPFCSALKIPPQSKNSAWINLYQNQRVGGHLYRTISSAGHTVNFLCTRCQEADALMPALRTVLWFLFPVFILLRILSCCFFYGFPRRQVMVTAFLFISTQYDWKYFRMFFKVRIRVFWDIALSVLRIKGISLPFCCAGLSFLCENN